MFHNKASCYGEDLSTPRPTPKLEDHTLSVVRDCLFNIFTATLHIGGRSSNRNLRTRHAVVTGTHFWWGNLRGKRPLGIPRLRWEDNTKMDLQKIDMGVWTGLSWLRIGVAGTFECGNEPSGSIKCGEFLD